MTFSLTTEDCKCGPEYKCSSDCSGNCCPCICSDCPGEGKCQCGDTCKCDIGCCEVSKRLA